MLAWFSQNWGTLVIAALLLLAVGAAARSLIKKRRSGKPSCGCDCAHCAGCAAQKTGK